MQDDTKVISRSNNQSFLMYENRIIVNFVVTEDWHYCELGRRVNSCSSLKLYFISIFVLPVFIINI